MANVLPAEFRGTQRARPAALGERCEVCGQVVRERQLLTSTYVGCGC